MLESLACFAIFQAITTRIPAFYFVYASYKLSLFSNFGCFKVTDFLFFSFLQVRIAQGLAHMGKGLLTLNPYHSDRILLSP